MKTIIELLGVIAWPATVIIAIILLKKEIHALLARLTKVKVKDIEAEFRESMKKLEQAEESSAAPSAEAKRKFIQGVDADRFTRLLQVSTRAAITEAWIEVERASALVAKTLGVLEGRQPIASIVLKMLMDENLFKPQMLEAYYTARRLRNEASHFPEFSISTDEAEKYIAFCLDLAARITAADTILKGKSQQGGGGYGSAAAGSPSPDR